MKREYNGLEAEKISFAESNQIVTTSLCKKVYVTHFDFDTTNLCDQAENPQPGGTWTELWLDSPW